MSRRPRQTFNRLWNEAKAAKKKSDQDRQATLHKLYEETFKSPPPKDIILRPMNWRDRVLAAACWLATNHGPRHTFADLTLCACGRGFYKHVGGEAAK